MSPSEVHMQAPLTGDKVLAPRAAQNKYVKEKSIDLTSFMGFATRPTDLWYTHARFISDLSLYPVEINNMVRFQHLTLARTCYRVFIRE